MQYHKPNWIKDHAIALGFWVGKYIARLPMPILLAAGKGVGKLSYYVAKKRRHIVERNIALCFPDLSKDAQTELVKENFNALGMGIFETLAAWLKPEAQVKELFIYEGLENLDAVKASGEGALLLTVHFCNLELGARAITLKTHLWRCIVSTKTARMKSANLKCALLNHKMSPSIATKSAKPSNSFAKANCFGMRLIKTMAAVIMCLWISLASKH
ncbi:protein Ddg [Wohlfahrtiimonas chitiniclastica]|nr:protein Ddg [Wohlfahrtiimonas chitiniclastica]